MIQNTNLVTHRKRFKYEVCSSTNERLVLHTNRTYKGATAWAFDFFTSDLPNIAYIIRKVAA